MNRLLKQIWFPFKFQARILKNRNTAIVKLLVMAAQRELNNCEV